MNNLIIIFVVLSILAYIFGKVRYERALEKEMKMFNKDSMEWCRKQ